MENIDPYIIEKQRAESPEDLLGRFLFRLVKLQNAGNQGLNGLNDRQYNRHIETQDLLSNVKKSIEDNKIDL